MTLTTSSAIFTVTEDGVSAISVGGSVRATGTWIASSADEAFDEDELQQLGTLINKSIYAIGATGAIVTHVYEHATISYHYTVNGADLDCRTEVQNFGDEPIRRIKFGTLDAAFSGSIHAYPGNNTWNDDYLHANGTQIMCPSDSIHLSGAYANDATWGIAAAADLPIEDRSLWVQYGLSTSRNMTLYVETLIPADGTKRFNMAWTAKATTAAADADETWQALLGRWKSYNIARYGRGHYEITDERPLGRFVALDASYVREDNPYGYNDGNGASDFRRFDKPSGITLWNTSVLAPAEANAYRGVIYWSLGGYNPRGINYPIDFNVFPDAVQENVADLAGHHANRELTMGSGSRPGERLITASETTDTSRQIIQITDDLAAEIASHYTSLIEQGFSEFYLDSVCLTGAQARLIQYIRSIVGPDVQLFTEYPSDATVPFAGSFAHLLPDGFDIYSWQSAQKYLMWLMDEQISIIAQTPSLNSAFVEHCYENRMSPMIDDYLLASYGAAQIASLNAAHLIDNVFVR